MYSKNYEKTKKLVSVAMFAALAYGVAALCYFLPKVSGFLSLDIKEKRSVSAHSPSAV